MVKLISEILENYGERLFLIDAINQRSYSFKEFHQSTCDLGAQLSQIGLQKGDRLALILTNSAEFALLYFACLYLGIIAVPINPQLHQRDIEFILRHSGVKATIYESATKKLLAQEMYEEDKFSFLYLLSSGEQLEISPTHQSLSLDKSPTYPLDYSLSGQNINPDDLLTITFTSGTTGLPKGVPHRNSSLIQSAIAFNQQLGFTAEDRFYHILPMAYMAGFLNTLLCPFLAGASVVIDRVFDARSALRFWQTPRQYQVNTLWLVPTMLTALMRVDRDRTGISYCQENIDTVCVGTAPLPLKLKQNFEAKYGVKLRESYGLSETLFVATNSKSLPDQPRSVGKPLPEVNLKILNEDGSELSPGKEGDIWIHSPFQMAGYLNYQTLQPEPSNSEEWFPSGDIGYLNADGYLFITGRKKDLIIRGGFNISPRAIEEILREHDRIIDVAVVGVPHEFYGEEIVAVVKLKAGSTLSEVRPALEKLCQKNLSPVSLPTQFFELEEFPTSSTGKIQKAKLREWLVEKLNCSN